MVTLFAPDKAIPGLAANRLARWALFLGQFQYTLEFRKTNHHQNINALSRLPSGEDLIFDEEKESDVLCAIETLSLQIQPTDSLLVKKESSQNPVLAKVMKVGHLTFLAMILLSYFDKFPILSATAMDAYCMILDWSIL